MNLIALTRRTQLYVTNDEYRFYVKGIEEVQLILNRHTTTDAALLRHWRDFSAANHVLGADRLTIRPFHTRRVTMNELGEMMKLCRKDAELNECASIVRQYGGFMKSRGIGTRVLNPDGSGEIADEGPWPTLKDLKNLDRGSGIELEVSFDHYERVGDEHYEPCPETTRGFELFFEDGQLWTAGY